MFPRMTVEVCPPPTPTRAMSPKANHRGPTHILPPPREDKAAPTGPLEPQSEVDSLSGFRVPRDESGPRSADQGPTGRIRVRRTNQGPAGRIRVRGTDQGQ